MKPKITPKDIIRDLYYMRNAAKKLDVKDKPYKKLLEFLISADFYDNEDIPIPSISELCVITSVPYRLLRKYLNEIYEDIMSEFWNNESFEIIKTKYKFLINHLDQWASISYNNLPHVPSVGDDVEFPCFKSLFGMKNFHVHEIKHYFENDVMTTTLFLKSHNYNSYFKLRKDEAIAKGEFKSYQLIGMSDYEIGKLLNLKIY